VIWCRLRIICPLKLPRFMEKGDKSKGGTVSLPEGISDNPRSRTKEKGTFLPTWPTNPCYKPSIRSDRPPNHLHHSPARPANLRPTWPSPCCVQRPPPQSAYRLLPRPPRSRAHLSLAQQKTTTAGACVRGDAWRHRG
jgi:hypothetical protein